MEYVLNKWFFVASIATILQEEEEGSTASFRKGLCVSPRSATRSRDLRHGAGICDSKQGFATWSRKSCRDKIAVGTRG